MRGPRLSDQDVDAVVEILNAHPSGLERHELVAQMNAQHRVIRDSAVRVAIENARARGELVLWVDGKYRIARSVEEVETWISRETEPRMLRFAEQMRAMRARCAVTFPPEQMRLGAA